MTNKHIPQAGPKRSSNRVSFAGALRNQEARRKEVVAGLRSIERECEGTLREAQRLRAYFEGNIDSLKAQPTGKLRKALWDAAHLDPFFNAATGFMKQHYYTAHAVAALVGAKKEARENPYEWRRRMLDVIFSSAPKRQAVDSDSPQMGAVARVTLSADAVLAEAARIARAAEDAAIEIDWSDNPASDKEAQLRLAIIRRIEIEAAKGAEAFRYLTNGRVHNLARVTLSKLRALEPNAEEIGSDLYDAIQRWQGRFEEERARARADRRRELLDAARRDLEGDEPA